MAEESAIRNPIRERRKERGLRVIELARILDVSPARIIQFENGHKPPNRRMEALARVLGVGVVQLRSEFTNYWDSFHDDVMEKAGLSGSL